MASSSSGGVAEVPVSANRRVASWVAAPIGPTWSMIRRQTAGTQFRRVARWRSTAAQISSAPRRLEQDDRVTGLPLLEGDGPGPHVEERIGADHRPAWLGQGARDASAGGWPGGRGPPPWAGRCSRW